MGQDDDSDCPGHDWRLVEAVAGQPAPFVPLLDTAYECSRCGAVVYAAAEPDAGGTGDV